METLENIRKRKQTAACKQYDRLKLRTAKDGWSEAWWIGRWCSDEKRTALAWQQGRFLKWEFKGTVRCCPTMAIWWWLLKW